MESGSVVFNLENTVSRVLNSCSSGSVFLAAVSGGADSMALLSALSVLISHNRLFCLHVEHGLRKPDESAGDAFFVKEFCEKKDIPCRIETIERGKITAFAQRRKTGIEAAARYFRRKSLVKEAKRISCNKDNVFILTAHTKNDALETILMRILRGAGSAGIALMPEKRGRFLRPLLSVSRTEIISYLNKKNIKWREDSTNNDIRFIRNKVRRKLVPLLEEFFPFWEKGVLNTGETQGYTADLIHEEAVNRIKWEDTGKSSISTDALNFKKQPLIIREEAVFLGFDRLFKGVKYLRTVKRFAVRKFCVNTEDTSDLGYARIMRKGEKIIIFRVKKEFFECGVSRLIKKLPLDNLNCIEKEI